MGKVFFTVYLVLLKMILLSGQDLSKNYIKIDKDDLFLKGKLFGNIKLVKVNIYSFNDDHLNKKLCETSTYRFNNKKDLIEIEYFNHDNKSKSVFHYMYDTRHNIVKEYSSNFKDTTYNYYDTNNKRIKTTLYSFDTLQTIYRYKYDNLSRLIEEYQFGLFLKYRYSNSSKNYTLCDIFDKDGKTLLESTIYDYDIDGNCIKKITSKYDKKSENIQEMKYVNSKLIYLKNSNGEFYKSYDNLGAIIKETKMNGTYEYKIIYDKLNNEKAVTVLVNGEKVEHYDYFYEYY